MRSYFSFNLVEFLNEKLKKLYNMGDKTFVANFLAALPISNVCAPRGRRCMEEDGRRRAGVGGGGGLLDSLFSLSLLLCITWVWLTHVCGAAFHVHMYFCLCARVAV